MIRARVLIHTLATGKFAIFKRVASFGKFLASAAGESGSIRNQEILHYEDSQANNATTIT